MTRPFTTIIDPRHIRFGDFSVRRALPQHGVGGVGPWVFFDHMGPHRFEPGRGLDVLPHPHIGLATVTYLFEGAIQHRDSLGSNREILPGAVNLMITGNGIAHSERTPAQPREKGHQIHGIQLWLALPGNQEECQPSFHHYPAADIPMLALEQSTVRVLIGTAYGCESPVKTFSETACIEYSLSNGSVTELADIAGDRAVYAVNAPVKIDGEILLANQLAILDEKARFIQAGTDTRLILIGGKSLGNRYMWWNFVSSDTHKIEKAKIKWKEGRFPEVTGDTDEYFPLPDKDNHARMTDY